MAAARISPLRIPFDFSPRLTGHFARLFSLRLITQPRYEPLMISVTAKRAAACFKFSLSPPPLPFRVSPSSAESVDVTCVRCYS